MQLSEGVEWAVHICGVLAAVPSGRAVSRLRLAEFYDLPPSYLAKQLQALSRAGIVSAVRGVQGGYQLARGAGDISLLDIALAVEGSEPVFHCKEIRQRGPCAAPPSLCRKLCPIARAFHAAEAAWRNSLMAVSLADIGNAAVIESFDKKRLGHFRAWLDKVSQPAA